MLIPMYFSYRQSADRKNCIVAKTGLQLASGSPDGVYVMLDAILALIT